MKLKDRNQGVPGGFYYKIPETGETVSTDGNFGKLVDSVYGYYQLKELPQPEFLEAAIEDQICSRIPDKFCRYSKALGDRISRAIQAVAKAVDKVAGTKLAKKAKGCGGCARRRQRMNKGN